MGKDSQRRIDLVFKRKRDDANEVGEDQSVPTDPPLPLLEFQQQQSHNQDAEQSNEAVTFRGIEFLQRDPGLRPQIWQYPSDQRDTVRRAYLMLGPMQPQLQNYERSGQKGHKRRFKYNWFGQFPSWLEYSQEKHRAYCLFCFVSDKRENTRGGSHVFTVNGFDSWKRINCGKHCAFLTHIGTGPCSSHQNAVADCQALMNQSCHVENLIVMKDKEKVERNRLRLKVSIAAVKWLTLQACAFRGHDERPQSKNKGNFLEIVDLLAEFNPDIAKVVGGNAPYNSKYTSPEIQKEILSMFACKIRKHTKDIMRGGRARHQPDQLTKEHYFRVEIFRATLDTQLFELNRRFNEKVMDLLSTSATLIPRNRFRGFKASDICEMVKYYPTYFTQQDIYGLQLQLKHFVSDASKDEELKNISTLIGLCQRLVETRRHTIFNLIERLLRLLITLPVSTTSAERAFSSMKIIKTRLRNKMEDDYLTNSLLVNIEGEILETYSYEDVIEDFRSVKGRRADL